MKPLTCLALAAVCAAAVPMARAEASNGIVAVVNDEVITQGDLDEQLSGMLQQEGMPAPAPQQAEQLRGAIIQRLIEERLILQDAKRSGITISADEVNERLEQIRERLGTKDAFETMLRQLDMSQEQLKIRLREQLLVQKAIQQKIRSKISVSATDVAKVATTAPAPAEPDAPPSEEVRAYHVLVRVTEDRTPEQAMALARELQPKLAAGDRGQSLAKAMDGLNGVEGSELEWVQPGQLLPELDEVLTKAPPGTVSEPVQTRLGVHLIRIFERRHAAGQQQLTPQQSAEIRVYQDKFNKAMDRWLKELKEDAYIDVVAH